MKMRRITFENNVKNAPVVSLSFEYARSSWTDPFSPSGVSLDSIQNFQEEVERSEVWRVIAFSPPGPFSFTLKKMSPVSCCSLRHVCVIVFHSIRSTVVWMRLSDSNWKLKKKKKKNGRSKLLF
jgi:hypothetical protein